MENICSILRKLMVLSGLITYENAFADKKRNCLLEFVILAILAGTAASNWIFDVTTLIDAVGKDNDLALLVTPLVLRGPVQIAAVIFPLLVNQSLYISEYYK